MYFKHKDLTLKFFPLLKLVQSSEGKRIYTLFYITCCLSTLYCIHDVCGVIENKYVVRSDKMVARNEWSWIEYRPIILRLVLVMI